MGNSCIPAHAHAQEQTPLKSGELGAFPALLCSDICPRKDLQVVFIRLIHSVAKAGNLEMALGPPLSPASHI